MKTDRDIILSLRESAITRGKPILILELQKILISSKSGRTMFRTIRLLGASACINLNLK